MRRIVPHEWLRAIVQAVSPPTLAGSKIVELVGGMAKEIVGPVEVRSRFGFRMKLPKPEEFIQKKIYLFGYWEWSLSRYFAKTLAPGDIVVDVGANVGWYTLLAASVVGTTGRVIAFEPFSENREVLEGNVRLNRVSNVVVEKVALSDRLGSAILHGVNPANDGMFSIVGGGGSDPRSSIVETRTLDDYCEEHGIDNVGLVKIDVEGAEGLVLRGMKHLLGRRAVGVVVFEASDWQMSGSGESVSGLVGLVQSCGYRMSALKAWGLQANALFANKGTVIVVGTRV